MPSGRTHDSITLWSLPVVAGLTFVQTQNGNLTLIVSGSFLFGGLMFGPDLDIYSQQYKRWGVLRWIWLPYRKQVRHRSFLSHGAIVGTVLRICYLSVWLGILGSVMIVGGAIVHQVLNGTGSWQFLAQQGFEVSAQVLSRSLQQHPISWLSAAIGLELGALSHSISDWVGSRVKRLKNSSKKRTS
ncbi:MAG: metal-binding protein [Leptolyngbyaceae cyanobacterium CSU_1_3]|nr:metal-binding protein [Leptolyngbyaceae cyanobacterium CSU_1_3]